MQALVTANATAAEDRACTKAASRVPAMKQTNKYIHEYAYAKCQGTGEACFPAGGGGVGGGTVIHHSAKDIDSTWCGGAVPAAIPELVLALIW